MLKDHGLRMFCPLFMSSVERLLGSESHVNGLGAQPQTDQERSQSVFEITMGESLSEVPSRERPIESVVVSHGLSPFTLYLRHQD